MSPVKVLSIHCQDVSRAHHYDMKIVTMHSFPGYALFCGEINFQSDFVTYDYLTLWLHESSSTS